MTETKDLRLPALRRFAFAITLLNVLGHTVLGFEQSWAAPLVGIATAYATEIALELIAAWQQGRRPRFLAGGLTGAVDFLLSAHITGLAVSMLLYSGEPLAPIAFAAAVAIGSKYIFPAPAPGALAGTRGSRPLLHPSQRRTTPHPRSHSPPRRRGGPGRPPAAAATSSTRRISASRSLCSPCPMSASRSRT